MPDMSERDGAAKAAQAVVKKQGGAGRILRWALLALYATALIAGISYALGCTYAELLRRISTLLVALLLYALVYEQQESVGAFYFENARKDRRNLLAYAAGIAVSAALSWLPVTGWPYPVIATALALLTGALPGIVGAASLLMVTTMLSGASAGVYCIYFLAAVLAVVLFTDFPKAYASMAAVAGHTLCFLFLLAALLLFYTPGVVTEVGLRYEMLLIPASHLALNFFLLLVIVRNINVHRLDTRAAGYEGLGDQTAPLMERIRTEQPDQYYRAIHATHFLAILLGCAEADPLLCRAGGYYAWTRDVYKNREKLLALYEEHHFPKELQDFLLSLKDRPYPSTEAFLVCLAYEVVELASQTETKDYETAVRELLTRHRHSDALDEIDLSFMAYRRIEDALLAEKKYLRMM